ncbi:MAG: hypothetical protein ABL308_14275 [Oceanicaulis sp.]
MLTPRRQAALIAFGLFVFLAALAIHASPLSAGSLEERLQSRADAALYEIRADAWAEVRVNGQVATVTGRAPDRAARDRALAVVQRADWAGGVVAGGITRVIDQTTVANMDARLGLRADFSSGRLVLSGFAPDSDAATRVVQQAERLFGDAVESEIRLAPGAAPLGWEAAVRLGLAELARLEWGSVLIEGERMALTGRAANAQAVETVRAAFESAAPGVFQIAALVRTEGQDFATEIADADLCELAVRAALGGRAIGFTPGLDTLAQGARPALRRAGEAYAACTTGPLEVRVRIEEDGGEALALDRARAIVEAMAEAGRPAEDFTVEAGPADAERAVRFNVVPFEPVDPGMGEAEGTGEAPGALSQDEQPEEG